MRAVHRLRRTSLSIPYKPLAGIKGNILMKSAPLCCMAAAVRYNRRLHASIIALRGQLVNAKRKQNNVKKDFWYDLPKELIAQEPADPRDSARLMVLDRKNDSIQHRSSMTCRNI